MFREIVNWLLGPYGRMLLDWYVAHNLLVNGLLVTIALLALMFPCQRDHVVLAVRDRWRKTPLALPERDRIAVERANARRRAMYAYTKRGRRRS
ncbi:MAG TPA: hypothetical protein VFO07_17080 [Roseiflexaceae bacterium]|nr:hypothetical protein [Roseiflexaceae bacterium]